MFAQCAQPAVDLSSSTRNSAWEAFRRGDFQAVLSLVEEGIAPSDSTSIGLLLLRARALLKLQLPETLIGELEPVLGAIEGVDARCTARMLYAAAVARVSVERGRALLAALSVDAVRLRAHHAVCTEITYYRAVAAWSAWDCVEADRLAAAVERTKLDVLSVRGMQLRGFIATSMTRYRDALACFKKAHHAYGACQETDVDLATIILEQIAALEQTLRSVDEPGTHHDPLGRTIGGARFGPAVASATRLRICCNDAWQFANDGECVLALRKMREAYHAATSPAWRVWALAGHAAIAASFGEAGTAQLVVDEAWNAAGAIDWDATKDEERVSLLLLAETAATLGAPVAAEILACYDGVRGTMDNTHALRDRNADPRFAAWYTYVRGLVARLLGDDAEALRLLREAASAFHACTFLWREALALIELDATAGSAVLEGPSPIEQAAVIVGTHFPRSFLTRRFGPWAMAHVDAVVRRLTGRQRDVLRHLLEGRQPQEIAALTGRSYQTVATHIKALHRALGTRSVQQIVAECGRRGVGAPSWDAQETRARSLRPRSAVS